MRSSNRRRDAHDNVTAREWREAGAVVMKLALNPAQFAAIQKVPIAAGVAVVSPVRQGGHITEYGIERD